MANTWLYLLLAGLFEIGFTTMMKLSNGFSMQRPGYVLAMPVRPGQLQHAGDQGYVPLGFAYAIWTVGVLGTVLVGIIWFGDPTTFGWLVFMAMLLLISVIGLKTGLGLVISWSWRSNNRSCNNETSRCKAPASPAAV